MADGRSKTNATDNNSSKLLRIVPVVLLKPTGAKPLAKVKAHDTRFLNNQTKQLKNESFEEVSRQLEEE